MGYRTIFITSQQNQLTLLKIIFDQNRIKYKTLKETGYTNFSTGVRVQVEEKHWRKAKTLLIENGILEEPLSAKDSISTGQFLVWLAIAILILIIVSVIITTRMR